MKPSLFLSAAALALSPFAASAQEAGPDVSAFAGYSEGFQSFVGAFGVTDPRPFAGGTPETTDPALAGPLADMFAGLAARVSALPAAS